LNVSLLLEDRFEAVDPFDITECRVHVDSSDIERCSALGGGLPTTGVTALRKSVYATGGVMGVLRLSFSCLMTADMQADIGVSRTSDGKFADLGVWRGGRTGLAKAGIVMSTTRESSCKAERMCCLHNTRQDDSGPGLTDTSKMPGKRAVREEGEVEGTSRASSGRKVVRLFLGGRHAQQQRQVV
jgi:hypothetical protein